LTPSDKATYDYLLGELRSRHRDEYRRKRCLIPGELKPLIVCPECNRCAACPYPEHRDKHQANELSWEELIGSGYEGSEQSDDADTRLTLEEVCRIIDAKNPKYTKAIVLKEYFGLSVAEIARELGTTERNVRFYIDEAKRIGRQYNNS
jgi:DNA-directed RNA polymerase specialized sigma24 family protein